MRITVDIPAVNGQCNGCRHDCLGWCREFCEVKPWEAQCGPSCLTAQAEEAAGTVGNLHPADRVCANCANIGGECAGRTDASRSRWLPGHEVREAAREDKPSETVTPEPGGVTNDCDTCAYEDRPPDWGPCSICDMVSRDKWKPAPPKPVDSPDLAARVTALEDLLRETRACLQNEPGLSRSYDER